jgi:cysteine synthase A
VILVDQDPNSVVGQVSGQDLKRVAERVLQLSSERRGFVVDQFSEVGNRRANLETGDEIWSQSDGRIDGFCDFVGTGGTFAGCAEALKAHDSRIRCYVVEPVGSTTLADGVGEGVGHPVQGGGYGYTSLPLLDRSLADGFLAVSASDAKNWCRYLAKHEGIFAGYSTGANLAAARILLDGPLRGGTIAIVANDTGLKYASTDLWR